MVRALSHEAWVLPSQTEMVMETSFTTLCVSSVRNMLLKGCVKLPLFYVVQNVCIISTVFEMGLMLPKLAI